MRSRTGLEQSASIRLDEWKKTAMSASDRVLCPLLDFKMDVCRLESTSTTAISRIEQEAHGMKASTVPVL
jgi:hypothetical protein